MKLYTYTQKKTSKNSHESNLYNSKIYLLKRCNELICFKNIITIEKILRVHLNFVNIVHRYGI